MSASAPRPCAEACHISAVTKNTPLSIVRAHTRGSCVEQRLASRECRQRLVAELNGSTIVLTDEQGGGSGTSASKGEEEEGVEVWKRAEEAEREGGSGGMKTRD